MSSEPKRRATETAQPPQTPQTPPTSAQMQVATQQRLPSDTTFQNSAKLAISEDKPIMLDYWSDSLDGKAVIGVRENGEKMLVKSGEEYTSPIAKIYRSGSEYIIMTENSIYLVSSTIANRRIANQF
jgi:hypothetical protein